MKKFKKLVAVVLVFAMLSMLPLSASALSMEGGLDPLKNEFVFAEGPLEEGYSIDYRYFSPVKENDTTKYPLVIWLHGMGDGAEDGRQVNNSQIAFWASDEFQARFQPAGGAFILAARSREEDGFYWDDEMIAPLRAAINDFTVLYGENIDLTRIYVGGYSMGGKMTLKMAISYPEMFAAAFPICPAWAPDANLIKHLKDMPIWLTSSTLDPLVNYYLSVSPTWDKITSVTNVAEDCRFSTITNVCYADGTPTSSAHHTWFAVNYDMFSAENGNYPNMTTVDGNGNSVELTYPDGMISWLSSHTSEYDGTVIDGTGNIGPDDVTDNLIASNNILQILFMLITAILKFFGLGN